MKVRTIVCAAALVALGTGAQAQQSATTGGDELQEVVVTAEKRVEDLSKVPISADVFDRKSIEELGLKDINDVASMTPGVDYQSYGNTNLLSIRGISPLASSANGYATVGTYIDDTPIQSRYIVIANGSTEPQVFDLDRVEVLRGPQGTLFGAGAEGGAIRFITPAPSLTQYSGYARAGLATTDDGAPSYEAGAAIGGPIVQDELGFRLSAWHRRDGGYIDHESAVPGGEDYDNSNWRDSDVVRAALTFAPTAALRFTPAFYYQHTYAHDIDMFEPANSSGYGDVFTGYLASLGPHYSNVSDGQFVNPALHMSPLTDQMYLPSLKVEFDLSGVNLVSNTSYVYRRAYAFQDWSDTVAGIIGQPWPTTSASVSNTVITQNQNIFTQEMRLQSADSAARLQWTVGAFYTRAEQDFYQVGTSYGPEAQQVATVLGQPLLPQNVNYINNIPTTDTQVAGFGQATYKLLDYLSLTAGVRVGHNRNVYSNFVAGPLGAPTPVLAAGSIAQNVVDPKVAVDFQLDENNLLYVSASKGDRVGGVNIPISYGAPGGACSAELRSAGLTYGVTPPPFKGDSLWSYELGSKNRLLNGRMQIDASVFYVNWSDIQQAIYFPECGYLAYTANAGKGVSRGFDLDINAIVVAGLKAGVDVGYTDAKNTNTVQVGTAQDVTNGQQINPFSSPWVITATTEYGFPVAAGHNGYVRVDDEYHSKNPGPYAALVTTNVAYNPAFIPNPSTNILNLHVGETWDRWDVSLYAKNLFNSHPLLFNQQQYTVQNLAGPGAAITFRPLTTGVTAEYRW